MIRIKTSVLLVALCMLSACAKSIYAPDADIQKRAYISPEPPYIELWTMVQNKTGGGGHSSLVVNGGPQLIMYDPAGRYWHSSLPERNDVLFGMTPQLQQRYKSWHARDTHHVVTQRVYVSKAVAMQAYQAALEQGASMDAMCATNVSAMLDKVDGFAQIPNAMLPAKLMKRFAKLPNVITDKHYETDAGNN